MVRVSLCIITGSEFRVSWTATCVIESLRRGVNKILVLLGCYAALAGSHRRFGANYLPHIQGPKSQRRIALEEGTDRLSRNVNK